MRKVYASILCAVLLVSFVASAAAPNHTELVLQGLEKFNAWKAQGIEHGRALGLLKQFYEGVGMQAYVEDSCIAVIGYNDKSVLLLGDPETWGTSGTGTMFFGKPPPACGAPTTWPTNGSAILLDPFDWQGGVFHNPALFDAITSDLRAAGYSVTYYSNSQVTISLIETKLDSGVVFNRGHGGYDSSTGEVLICSGERWNSSKYTYEQGQGWVVRAYISQGGVYYDFFAYFPGLITYSYSNLPKSLIYMESCEGIKNSTMADAWLGAGAGAYMSWTRSVLVVDGDATAEANFHDLCINGLSVCQVVAKGYASGGAKLAYKGNGTLGL